MFWNCYCKTCDKNIRELFINSSFLENKKIYLKFFYSFVI
ncbi:hypothetical protein BbiDN127_B0004 (plasmid) [Borreliella bissettiae DN127]|uniref:Uncharacterized protein n=1 Tax=Borrelia bissettiae (strain DSM 17990 / CIP 109136 / DN127) TaxID=521010 RepID=G0AMT4_BORBD|nr:hypothetical protein BbiDN127_B0004 [Borreliella bissettiae DN127]